MDVLETVALGIMQGLTEFLPVSSSGHLVVFKHLMGSRELGLLLDTVLHLATVVSVCIFFRRELSAVISELYAWVFHRGAGGGLLDKPYGSLALWVSVGTIPTAAVALGFREPLESLFGSPKAVGFMMLATGCIVGITRLIPERYTTGARLGLWTALSVGLAQGAAIMPGISRSGITIVCALLFGLRRDLAGKFSFILSIPAICGAVILQLDLDAAARIGLVPLVAGFVASVLVGLGALHLVISLLDRGRLYYFAPYCWLVGFVILLVS
jgi:undecaprenyl-diphosphatase